MDGTRKYLSEAYVEHRKRGPFPGRIDPWAEVGRYFHQIHLGIIGSLLSQIQDPLLRLGYEAGRETSLLILERSEPDIFIHRAESTIPALNWDYSAAAKTVEASPGVTVERPESDQQAIYIRDIEDRQLVTVIEVISPSNKSSSLDIADYDERRERALRHGVNVVEIDPSRSVKRLLRDVIVQTYAYHTAVHLPGQLTRVIGSDFGEPLKRVALPLRGEVIPMELQDAYDFAYQQVSIAGQIYSDGGYTEDNLPFPSLLTEPQRREAMQAVLAWIEQLEHLRLET